MVLDIAAMRVQTSDYSKTVHCLKSHIFVECELHVKLSKIIGLRKLKSSNIL